MSCSMTQCSVSNELGACHPSILSPIPYHWSPVSEGAFMTTKHIRVLIHIRIRLSLVLSNILSPPVIFLPIVPRWCFFCGSFFLFVFCVLSCLFFVVCGRLLETADLWVLWYVVSCALLLSHMVPWVRCDT